MTTKTTKRIPVAVSSEQADLIDDLHHLLGEASSGHMGFADLKKGRDQLERLRQLYAQQRIDLGLSKGMKV